MDVQVDVFLCGKHRQASSGIVSLLQAEKKQLLVGHSQKKSCGVQKIRQGHDKKKSRPGSLDVEEKLNSMCKASSTRSSGVEKKKVQKAVHQTPTAEGKNLEKKPNDFESTDADRITCKGTHYFMGA